jgi:hypothetical protein
MEKGKRRNLLPRLDYVTVLIILVFLALTCGVFLYYKHRIAEIDSRIKQSHAAPINYSHIHFS